MSPSVEMIVLHTLGKLAARRWLCAALPQETAPGADRPVRVLA